MPTFYGRALTLASALGALAVAPGTAHAEEPIRPEAGSAEAPPKPEAPRAAEPKPEPAPVATPPLPETASAAGGKPEVVPGEAAERKLSVEPKRSEPPPTRITFDIDPIADGAMIAISLGFFGTLSAISSTGEIRPQQISPNFDTSSLIGIDRQAVTRTPDPSARTTSTIAQGVAIAYAVIDPILSGVREKSVQTGLADAFMYAESASFTLAMTSIVKMAVRRPRPIAYIEADAHKDDPDYANNSTDSALSFFSGHAALTASLGATATYLAFARSPRTARPWITLVVGVGLTTFVSIERVRAGQHFPTDVIAGSIAGTGMGLIVPHLHRTDDIKQRRIWVGFAPLKSREGERGGLFNVSGVF